MHKYSIMHHAYTMQTKKYLTSRASWRFTYTIFLNLYTTNIKMIIKISSRMYETAKAKHEELCHVGILPQGEDQDSHLRCQPKESESAGKQFYRNKKASVSD